MTPARLNRAIRDFLSRQGGNVAIAAALLFPVIVAAAALIVDEAALYHQKRQVQAAVDLAAIHAAADPANALAHAHRTLLDHNLVDPAIPLAVLADPATGPLKVVTGRYFSDRDRSVAARFEAGAAPANAAEVHYRVAGRLHLARVFMPSQPDIGASALASATPRAAFSIGSRLARLEDGVVNALLGPLLGTNVSLSLVGYDALLGLDVDLLSFLDALAGRINLEAGTYEQVLGARVTLADIAAALRVAAAGSDPAALDILLQLSRLASDTIYVEMARLVAADGLADLALGQSGRGAEIALNALEMLTMSALLADGQRQAQLRVGLDIPLATATASLVVGEPPQGAWFAFGEPGSYVRTAQLRLRIDIELAGHGDLVNIRLPVHAELAYAEATLAALSCPPGNPGQGTASLAVRPGVLRLAIGQSAYPLSDTARPLLIVPARIATVAGLADVMARADVQASAVTPQIVHFSHADVVNGTVRTVSTATPLESLSRALIDDIDLELRILGGSGVLGGLLSGVVNAILSAALDTLGALLVPVAPALDKTLTALLTMLGVSVGTADARVHGLDCRAAALVR